MKKSELKVGEHYAVGGSGTYDRWRMEHVELLEINGIATVRRSGWSDDVVHKTGYICKALGVSTNPRDPEYRRYGQKIIGPGREGQLFFESGRSFIELWQPYADRLAARNAGIKAREDKLERDNEIITTLVLPFLHGRGVDANHHDGAGTITFTAEEAAKALGLTP